MKNKKILILILIIVILLVIALLGGTLAWYVWSTSSDEDVQVIAGLEAATVLYSGGNDITNVSLKPVASKENGIVKKIRIKYSGNVYYTLSFNLYLDIIELGEGLKDASFKYQIYKDNGATPIKEGNFSNDYLTNNLRECTPNSTNHIVLLSNEKITSSLSTYTLYIWIDGTMSNPNTMQNQTFNFKLHADGQNAILGTLPTTAEYITNLYTEADKATVKNNGITYNYANIYDIDDDSTTSGGLMNDRLGGTTADYDAGNIRYYGASPNNYIYFNCSNYSNQSDTTCEKWRIIGVFDDKVKIIRNESIGPYSWDNKNTSTGAETDYGKNDWTTARLMKLLNPSDYYTIDSNDNGLGQSLYYTAQSGTCYSSQNNTTNATTSCNFTSAGLKNDTTRNMIAEVTWNLGGWNSNSVYSKNIYGYERGTKVYSGRPTEWLGKVALAYPSDYGYAADFNSCTQTLGSYNDSICTGVNWMKTMFGSNSMWLLAPCYGISNTAWYVSSSGLVHYGNYVVNAVGVRPVLYLNSEASIESGDGSSSLPYRLSVG